MTVSLAIFLNLIETHHNFTQKGQGANRPWNVLKLGISMLSTAYLTLSHISSCSPKAGSEEHPNMGKIIKQLVREGTKKKKQKTECIGC